MELPADVGIGDHSDAEVLFVGYLNAIPLWASLTFGHGDTNFLPPILEVSDPEPRGLKVFSGSKTVFENMQRDGLIDKAVYLREAINLVRLYAHTCIKNNRTIPDCKNLGGRIHIARVTRRGCSWVEPPLLSTRSVRLSSRRDP